MAATLEGAFDIRDKASAKLIAMRLEAEKTDKAFIRLGLTMDAISSGKRVTQLNNTSRSLRTLGLDAENAAKRTDHLARRSKQADTAMGGWGGRLRMVSRGLKDFGMELFKIARPGAILVGLPSLLGLAGQAVGSLAGSLFSLGPRIADLGALSAVALPGITGLAGGMLLLSSSAKTLGQAMQGGTAGAQALLKGGPALAGVVRQLRAMRFELRSLSRAGQAPIFRAISGALPLFRSRIPALRGMLGQLGGATGGAITGLTRGTLGDRSFMRDLGGLTGQGASVIRSVGQALTHVARALVSVGAAARPLTHWVNGLIVGWAKHFEQTMKARRASGQLTQQFDRAKTAVVGLGHFVRDLWITLRNLGRDARPAGEILYRYLGGVGRTWRQMTGDQTRSVRLTRQFLGMTRGFIALSNLLGHLTAGIFNMGSGSAFPRLVQTLDKAIPPLLKFFSAMAQQFGPAIGTLLTTLTQTFQLMSGGAGGPMLMLLNTLNSVLGAVNGLVKALGPFGRIITVAFEGAVLLRFLSKLRLVEVGWRRVAVAAGEAAAAENVAAGGGGGFGIRAGAALQGLGFGSTGRFARMGMRRRFLAGGPRFIGGPGGQMVDAAAIGRFGGIAGAARGGMLGGAGRLALGVGSKFLLPLAAIMGGFGALSAQRSGGVVNQTVQTVFGGLQAASGGLIGAGLGALGLHPESLQTPEQQSQRMIGLSQRHLQTALRNTDQGTSGMRRLNREIDVLQVTMQGFARDQTDAGRQYRDQLQQEIDARKGVIAQLKGEAQQRAGTRGTRFADSLNALYARTPGTPAHRRAVVAAAGERTIAGEQERATRLVEANAVLSNATPAERRTLGPTLARLVGGGATFGGGTIEAGGQSERNALRATMSLPGQNTAVMRARLFANLAASGYVHAYGAAAVHGWIANWIARGMKGTIVPQKTLDYWARVHRQQRAGAAYQHAYSANPSQFPLRIPHVPPAPYSTGPYKGFTPGQAAGAPMPLAPSPYFPPNPLFPPMHAAGGRLAGRGLHDTISLAGMAAPGELIVNRHQESAVNAMLAPHGMTLGGVVEGVTTHHSERFAAGGRASVATHGTQVPRRIILHSTESDAPAGAIADFWRKQGLGYGSQYIVQQGGQAVQLASPTKVTWHTGGANQGSVGIEMSGFANWPRKQWGKHRKELNSVAGLLATLSSRYSIPLSIGTETGVSTHAMQSKIHPESQGHWDPGPGFPLRSVLAAARNGANVKITGGGGGGGGGSAAQRKRLLASAKGSAYDVASFLPGSPEMGLGGLQIRGDQGSLAAELMGGGASGGRSAGGGGSNADIAAAASTRQSTAMAGGGNPAANKKLGHKMMLAAGWPDWEWPALLSLWTGESGWRENAVNLSSRAQGIPQILPMKGRTIPAGFPDTPPLSGGDQIAWGLNYIRGRYTTPSAALASWRSRSPHWYQGGGRIPKWGGWHQGGLDRTFSTPTVIGVGEGGQSERVRVTKTGRGGGGGAQIHAVFHINGGDPGRVRREVEAALHSFADELDRHYGSDAGGE